MFPVAPAHSILATKFACSSPPILHDLCIIKKWKKVNHLPQKTSYKIIFWPEYAEDISYVSVVNQIFESIFDLFLKQISKKIGPLPVSCCVCTSSYSVDKKIVHCCFSIN